MDPVSQHRSFFDRFAAATSSFVSRAPFFAVCVGLVVLWAPTFLFVPDFDTWQLLINTPTTILTFLLVAILQNAQRRSDVALQHKIDALADGLADLMEHFTSSPTGPTEEENLRKDIDDLKESVGLEDRVSSSE